MTHASRRTSGFSGSNLHSIVPTDADQKLSDLDILDAEEHVPEEVHSDPELWFDIGNDPAIWPENKTAAYRAALRGERDWHLASADDLERGEATGTTPAERNARPPYLRGVK